VSLMVGQELAFGGYSDQRWCARQAVRRCPWHGDLNRFSDGSKLQPRACTGLNALRRITSDLFPRRYSPRVRSVTSPWLCFDHGGRARCSTVLSVLLGPSGLVWLLLASSARASVGV
jgi:hypothetical protein